MKHLLSLIVLVLIGIGIFLLWPKGAAHAPGPTACTAEAKICPDGSAVGREGPNCEFAACPEPGAPVPADITLGVGETGKVENLAITFNKSVQDSRCPIDVQCIQAGAVNINVTFAQGPHVETTNMPSDEVPQEFEGYKISIIDVNPPRKSQTEINPSDYEITFHVSK